MDASACAMSVHEARRAIAVADSLRVNEGVAYDDSAALAETYCTLDRWRIVYPNDYARACYYYGRLLRNRGDQVGAMQAFISGTHAPYMQRLVPLPWFNDYHILGRIYSNMGTMCHLVGDFELSYDMYELSAKQFYRACDTTLYYYALNAKALQLAEQSKHDETLSLLDCIEHVCTDSGVIAKLWETKAILYFNLNQYDSTIYSVKQLQSRGNLEPIGYVKEAQAFWCMQHYDSALYYAQIVLQCSDASNQDRYNMLYLVSNHDTTLNVKAVQEIAAQRADIYYEQVNPLLQQLSVATELLHQSFESKPYYIHLWILAVLLAIGGVTWGAEAWIRKRHKQLRQITLIEQAKQKDLQIRQQQLQHSNEHLEEQYRTILQMQESQHKELTNAIEYTCECLRKSEHLQADLQWKDYPAMCNLCNDYFHLLITKLHALAPLSEKETRLCVLVLIGLSRPQIAYHIRYSQSGIGKLKDTTAKRIGTTGAEMHDFLVNLAAKA